MIEANTQQKQLPVVSCTELYRGSNNINNINEGVSPYPITNHYLLPTSSSRTDIWASHQLDTKGLVSSFNQMSTLEPQAKIRRFLLILTNWVGSFDKEMNSSKYWQGKWSNKLETFFQSIPGREKCSRAEKRWSQFIVGAEVLYWLTNSSSF